MWIVYETVNAGIMPFLKSGHASGGKKQRRGQNGNKALNGFAAGVGRRLITFRAGRPSPAGGVIHSLTEEGQS